MNVRLPLVCLQLEKNASVFGFNRVIHDPSVIASRMGQLCGNVTLNPCVATASLKWSPRTRARRGAGAVSANRILAMAIRNG